MSMLKTYNTIELTQGVTVRTSIKGEYIPALRSGFALYPINPRWNAWKLRAWKCGRQLRQAYDRGERDIGHIEAIATIEPEESLAVSADRDPSRWSLLQPVPTV